MMRVALLVLVLALALTSTCNAILPEIVDSGVSHILEDDSAQGPGGLDRTFVEVEQLKEAQQPKPGDAFQQKNVSTGTSATSPSAPPPNHQDETTSNKVTADQETNNTTTTAVLDWDLGNSIYQGCITNEDCGRGKYCLHDSHSPKCLPCKATDVPCTKDEECCSDQLCVWGQCSQNATKGEPGTTCRHQTDCSPELCCAFHKALLFPVCLAKPIERERCFGASNHLMEMLSWNLQDEEPRKHCPCAGNLHCQHLGRGSMCLKGKDSSEEDLTDTLYSEIDYII